MAEQAGWRPSTTGAPTLTDGLDAVLAERWFQALYETPLLFSGILDLDGRILDGNELSIEGCGFDRAEVLGVRFWDCGWWNRDPDVRAAAEDWFRQVVASASPLRATSRYFLADGTPRMVDLAFTPVRDDAGDVRFVVAAGNDITVREQELASAQELEHQAESRLRRLAAVAMDLVHAETIEDLTEIVVNDGVPVLGADGGAVIVRGPESLLLAVSDRLGAPAQERFAELELDNPLGGPRAATTGRRVVLPDVATGLAFAPEMAEVYELTGRKAWACEPLWVGEELLGALLVSWVEERVITDDDLALIAAFAAQCAQALRRIQASAGERGAVQEVLRLSESLQSALLTQPPTSDDVAIAVRYLPALEAARIGGDWHDAFLTMGGTTVVSIGDVFGHDSTAAATMAQLRNLFRGIAIDSDGSPGLLLTRLEQVMEQLDVRAFASAVVARVEREDGVIGVRWSNAGHPPPLLRLPDLTVRVLDDAPGRILGVEPDLDRIAHCVEVPEGTLFVLYTDGLVERRTESLDQGIARLADALGTITSSDPEEVCDQLLAAGLPSVQEDDVALLVLRA